MSESNLRTVTLSDTPSMLRARLVTPEIPVWRAKIPFERLTYSADTTALVGTASVPATITTSASPTGAATVNSTQMKATGATQVISKGTAGVSATVEMSLTFADGSISRAASCCRHRATM